MSSPRNLDSFALALKRRESNLKARLVACPVCKAPADVRCTKTDGSTEDHVRRRQAAARAGLI